MDQILQQTTQPPTAYSALHQILLRLDKQVGLRLVIAACVILFMANLDALTDGVIRRDSVYFSQEHFIVGGVTGAVTTILFGLLAMYVASLKKAMKDIKTLEGLLPICSACHKIRTPDNHWHILEKYISDRTEAVFTHSLCPDCAKSLYPEMFSGASGANPKPS